MALKASVQDELDHEDTVILENVPAFNWTYGCTATAAGMLIGYYDRNGYPNLYTGEVSGGICPLTDQSWVERWGPGSPGLVSFIASKKGVDGLETNGHIDDFYTYYLSEGDPFYGNWEPHCHPGEGNCLADFMGTSQWYPNDLQFLDGGSAYDTPPLPPVGGPYPTDPNFESSTTFGDAPYGIKLYIESKGYTVDFYGSQHTCSEEDYQNNWYDTGDIRFKNFQAEIDAGRPVLLHLVGHSMLGIGYNATFNKVFFHDTWDQNIHSMEWEGTYANLSMRACSFIRLDPSPDTTVTVDITSNLNISDGSVEPFGSFQIGSCETIPLTAGTSDNGNVAIFGQEPIIDARFVRWETTGAVSVANPTASETTFTGMGGGGTIMAVYEELSELLIKKLYVGTGCAGRDYIRLNLPESYSSGITTGKLVIDDYEYDFSNVPTNGTVKNGNLTIKNKNTFQFSLKKQTLDLFDTTDGLWIELQINGDIYRKELNHRELGIKQSWKSTAEINGTNINVSKFTAKYIVKRNNSTFTLNMKGTGLDPFSDTPTLSLGDSSWNLSAPDTSRQNGILYKQTDAPKHKLFINPTQDKWNMTLKDSKVVGTAIPDHPEEDTTAVTMTITDGSDTVTSSIPCNVNQRIQYNR